ncbi:hypothetical protein B0H10DRAFT_55057 [Mycena sp. CBHHK59/15]|nr:hypothetical protein B0H10DRAFT_55057 [Mycena sp. CBHHK59/15]
MTMEAMVADDLSDDESSPEPLRPHHPARDGGADSALDHVSRPASDTGGSSARALEGPPPKRRKYHREVPSVKRCIVGGAFAVWEADPSLITHKDYIASSFRVLPGGPCGGGASIVKKAGLQQQSFQTMVATGKGPVDLTIDLQVQVRYGILFAPRQFCLFERAVMTDTNNLSHPALLVSPFLDTAWSREGREGLNVEVGALIALWFTLTIPGKDVTHADGSVTSGVPHDADIDVATLAEKAVVERMLSEMSKQYETEDAHLEELRAKSKARQEAQVKGQGGPPGHGGGDGRVGAKECGNGKTGVKEYPTPQQQAEALNHLVRDPGDDEYMTFKSDSAFGTTPRASAASPGICCARRLGSYEGESAPRSPPLRQRRAPDLVARVPCHWACLVPCLVYGAASLPLIPTTMTPSRLARRRSW